MIPVTLTTFLEYSGAGLGIIGWLGVRQIGSITAQQLGFLVWIIGGLILIAWGYHTKARAIMLINTVNVVMAVSALAALRLSEERNKQRGSLVSRCHTPARQRRRSNCQSRSRIRPSSASPERAAAALIPYRAQPRAWVGT